MKIRILNTATVVERCSHGVATICRPRPTMRRTGGFPGERQRSIGRTDGLGAARSPGYVAVPRRDEAGMRVSTYRRVECGRARQTSKDRASRISWRLFFGFEKISFGLSKDKLAVKIIVGGSGGGHVAHQRPCDPSWELLFGLSDHSWDLLIGLSQACVDHQILIHGLGPILGQVAGLCNSVFLTSDQVEEVSAEEAQTSLTS